MSKNPLRCIPQIFFNHQQGRLRAGVRLTGTTVLVVIGFALAASTVDATHDPFLQRFATEVLALPLVMLALWVAIRGLDHRSMAERGIVFTARAGRELAAGLAVGAALMTAVFAAGAVTGMLDVSATLYTPDGRFGIDWGTQLLRFTSVGVYEEALMRGYLLTNLAEGLPIRNRRHGLLAALFLSSALFGLAHLGNPGATVASTANIVLAGLFLGLGFVATGSLAFPVGAHITWNFFQGNVFGFPVSGTDAGASLIDVTSSSDVWTGGGFGPEGGLLGTVAASAGCVAVWWWWRTQLATEVDTD